MLLFDVVQGRTPSDYPVAVWIESPKQNEKIYFYLSENPTFNATVRLRALHAVGALSLRVFFQGTQVAEVAAESDTVSLSFPAFDVNATLEVQVVDMTSGIVVSEVFGVDFTVKISKRFVYMTQSEDVFLHSGIQCSDCDVVLLTWQTQRPGAIFLPNSSYPQGANAMLRFALEADAQYLYYIFVADDARLSEALHRSSLTGNPFRTMEEELLHWQPAIGFPCLDADDCASASNAVLIPDVEVRRNFDHVMFATHREALPFLFPYTRYFDNISWWYADGVVTTLAASFYAPHVLRFNRVIVKNEQHRPYPKEGAWHRLRHFTLAALRYPSDAMNLNYNPEWNPVPSQKTTPIPKGETTYVVDASRYNQCHVVYQPQWLGHEYSLFPHIHSLKLIAECIEDGGESARWGLVFRVLEQQQQAIRALQQELKAKL